MSGLGRRTHYRKNLTGRSVARPLCPCSSTPLFVLRLDAVICHVPDQVLYDLPEPETERDSVAIVVGTRGSNQFDVRLPHTTKAVLAILPTKFRKLVWLKRNDFIIVETVNEDETEDGKEGIRYMIKHILYKDQVQHLVSKNLWPSDDEDFAAASQNVADDTKDVNDDGIVYQASDEEDDLLAANTNRIAAIQLQESSDESDAE